MTLALVLARRPHLLHLVHDEDRAVSPVLGADQVGEEVPEFAVRPPERGPGGSRIGCLPGRMTT